MPQVPYRPYPEVSPLVSGEHVDVQTTPAQFGANVGAAIDHLGTTIGHAGQEMWDRAIGLQNLQNETLARSAASDYSVAQADLQSKFDLIEGNKSQDALMDHVRATRELRERMGQGLSPAARKMYDADTFNFMDRNIFSSVARAASEFKKWNIVESAADVKNQITTPLIDPNDPKEFAERQEKIERAIKKRSSLENWGPEKEKMELDDASSGLNSERINGIGRTGDIDKAFDELEDARKAGTINEKDYETAFNHLHARNLATGPTFIVNKVFNPKKGPDQMMEDAEPLIKKLAHTEEGTQEYDRFKEAVRVKILSKLMYDERMQKEMDRNNSSTITDAINKGEVTDPASLINHPTAGPAFASLKPEEKNKFMGRKLQTQVENVNMQTDLRSLKTLEAMRTADPDGFQRIDPYDTDWKLSGQHIKQILNEQRHDLKEGYQNPLQRWATEQMIRDPRFEPALRRMGVRYAPLKGATDEDKANYNAYQGQLLGALDAWREEHDGKMPTAAEFQEKIAPQIIRAHTEDSFLHNVPLLGRLTDKIWSGPVYDFNTKMEQNDIDAARDSLQQDALRAGYDWTPTDDDVRRKIITEQWKKFFKEHKSDSSGGSRSGISD